MLTAAADDCLKRILEPINTKGYEVTTSCWQSGHRHEP